MDGGFSHEAFFYGTFDEFVEGVVAFVREAAAAGEATLVAVPGEKVVALRAALGEAADEVHFADMRAVGRNPARIIPAWRRFVDEQGIGDRPVRGIGEPVWPGRSSAELVECRHHEALLNLAFADAAGFRLLCPYDRSGLGQRVLAHALGTHPLVWDGDDNKIEPSPCYRPVDPAALLREPLPEAPEACHRLAFGSLRPVRSFVSAHLRAAGVAETRAADVVLAVNEIAANSLVHGGGEGVLNLWFEGGSCDHLVCQVADKGQMTDPLVGRQDPTGIQRHGRGLWLVNQLCDVAQVRSFAEGAVTRLHFRDLGAGSAAA